jgi:hypothetical protein
LYAVIEETLGSSSKDQNDETSKINDVYMCFGATTFIGGFLFGWVKKFANSYNIA